MSVVIKGFDKPASCFGCPFNHSDCWCTITEGGIDRDDYSCDLHCPIEPLDTVLDEIRAEIEAMPCAITSMREIYVNRDKVINILDKHRAERGGEE